MLEIGGGVNANSSAHHDHYAAAGLGTDDDRGYGHSSDTLTWDVALLLFLLLLISAWFGARLIEVLGLTGSTNPALHSAGGIRLGGFIGFERPPPVWRKAPAHSV